MNGVHTPNETANEAPIAAGLKWLGTTLASTMHNVQSICGSNDGEGEEGEEEDDGMEEAMIKAEEAMSETAKALKQLDQAAMEHFAKVQKFLFPSVLTQGWPYNTSAFPSQK